MEIKDNLKNEMDLAGLNPYDLQKLSKVPQPTIHRILTGESKFPRADTLKKLAQAMNISHNILIDGRMEENPVTTTNRRSPVVGTAQLGDDGYWMELDYGTGNGDGFIDVPSNDPNAYSLKVKGDSMRPAIKSGWYVVCEPNHELVVGEYVMVKTVTGKSMVKELIICSKDQYVLGSINEDHGRLTLEPAEVEKIHYVAFIAPPSKHSI